MQVFAAKQTNTSTMHDIWLFLLSDFNAMTHYTSTSTEFRTLHAVVGLLRQIYIICRILH